MELADGSLGIAKFPKPDDTRDIAAGEILALTVAREAGVQVPECQLVALGARTVAVIRRFDRAGLLRMPFISAATLLGQPPDDPGSYTLMADGIRQFGDAVTSDLRELWRRMVFNLLVSNFDDHLRNHGFLMHQPGRWSLSPEVSSFLACASGFSRPLRGAFTHRVNAPLIRRPARGLPLAAVEPHLAAPAKSKSVAAAGEFQAAPPEEPKVAGDEKEE